jgi:hypothetical protein
MWNHIVIGLIGLWLIAAPSVMGYEGPEVFQDRLVGALVACLALLSSIATLRRLRWATIGLGLWLMLAPVVLQYHPNQIGVRSSLIGMAIAILSLIERPRRRHADGESIESDEPSSSTAERPAARQTAYAGDVHELINRKVG